MFSCLGFDNVSRLTCAPRVIEGWLLRTITPLSPSEVYHVILRRWVYCRKRFWAKWFKYSQEDREKCKVTHERNNHGEPRE